jgi:hypothetical protein
MQCVINCYEAMKEITIEIKPDVYRPKLTQMGEFYLCNLT